MKRIAELKKIRDK